MGDLTALAGVGPATLCDFHELGIRTTAQLARRSPERIYAELSRRRGRGLDPCCLDVFRCAVAQARDPHLPDEQRQWWYWSRLRKSGRLPAATRASTVER